MISVHPTQSMPVFGFNRSTWSKIRLNADYRWRNYRPHIALDDGECAEREFNTDIEFCTSCGGRLEIIARIEVPRSSR